MWKPVKGTATIERRERRKSVVAKEDEFKAEVRKRDKKCRLPHCPYCKRYKDLVPQAAHVIQAKGHGGDPTLIRSQPNQMMLLDPLAHGAQERHEFDVEPLTTDGTNGICAFYLCEDVYDQATGDFHRERLLWDREVAIGVPEHKHPLVRFKRLRRDKEPD